MKKIRKENEKTNDFQYIVLQMRRYDGVEHPSPGKEHS